MLEITAEINGEKETFLIQDYRDWQFLFYILNDEYLEEPIEDWISRRDLL